MLFTVNLTPRFLKPRDDVLTIVIDILRASTTICIALLNGAKEIYPVSEVNEAYTFRKKHTDVILAGERDGKKIPGFDLGNSPLEYDKDKVDGKTICLCTTNGTRILSACHSTPTIVGSFKNIDTIVKSIIPERYHEVQFACAGQANALSLEDVYCAGVLINLWLDKHKKTVLEFDEGAKAAISIAKFFNNNINLVTEACFHAQYLISIGFKKDVDFCFTKDTINIIPRLDDDGFIRIR
jgi:2-phosphosulfolactate phosphatase